MGRNKRQPSSLSGPGGLLSSISNGDLNSVSVDSDSDQEGNLLKNAGNNIEQIDVVHSLNGSEPGSASE